MTKSEIRKKVYETRLSLSDDFISKNSEIICDKLIEKFPDRNLTVFSYLGVKNEVKTDKILSYYNNVYLPKTIDDTMLFCHYDGRLEIGNFNIPEPCGIVAKEGTVPDLVVVPGVGFDLLKNRTGYGKGFYDKFLAKYKDVKKVGLAFSFQIFDLIQDCGLHDIKMDEILTENKNYE